MRKYILLLMFSVQCLNVLAQNWLPTGNGTNNGGNGGVTLLTFNGKLIAGGAFSQAGTVNAIGVAMWDGVDWSIVDTAMNSFFAVRPLIIFHGHLYGFVNYNYANPRCMLMLDSTFKWHVVQDTGFTNLTFNGYIYSACVYNNELYVGGGFDTIGNVSANHIAKWDGSNWMPVGTGIDKIDVNGMIVYNNELYVGGAFTEAGGVPVHDLAKWNGSNWSDVGGGITGASYWAFREMEVYNNELYICGDLDSAGSQPMVHITRWNGSTFSDVGGGLGPAGYSDALKVYGNKLIVSVTFGVGIFQNQAATWDGVNFDSLGTGINAGPTGFEIYNCKLYAGGRFSGMGSANGVAVLDTLDCSTGVSEINLPDNSISIYPNPFSFQTTITFNAEQRNTIVRIKDILGKEIKTINFTDRQLVIDKGEMKAGIYFVQVSDGERNVTRKLVVE